MTRRISTSLEMFGQTRNGGKVVVAGKKTGIESRWLKMRRITHPLHLLTQTFVLKIKVCSLEQHLWVGKRAGLWCKCAEAGLDHRHGIFITVNWEKVEYMEHIHVRWKGHRKYQKTVLSFFVFVFFFQAKCGAIKWYFWSLSKMLSQVTRISKLGREHLGREWEACSG